MYNIIVYNYNCVISLSVGVIGKMVLGGLRIGLCCFRQHPLAWINVFLPATELYKCIIAIQSKASETLMFEE